MFDSNKHRQTVVYLDQGPIISVSRIKFGTGFLIEDLNDLLT
jgi:hypothetical protein